ncbi:hypothetical protein ACOMHN_027894 [Nucella lapillus]
MELAATNGQATGSEDDPGEQPHHPAAPRPPVVTVATPRDSAQVGFEVDDGLIEAMGAASLDPSLTGQTAPQRRFKSALSKMLQRSYKKKKIKCKDQVKNDKIDIKAEYAKRQCGRELLNLVVIGHVDAGKSTVMGHVLFQLGCVQKRTMHKYEQESRKMGKSSFAYAWVLDETDEERSRGVTMDVAQTRFVTDSKLVTLLDTPGHKDFIPNMITGAAQADVAILVVNATCGEFETGFNLGGQTREHTLLARSLGVSQIIVAVNKMDTVSWDQGRYEEIVAKLQQFLKQVGFKDRDLSYIPCSGLNGENLTKSPTAPELCKWYSGPSLLAQIDQFRSPERPMDKPLRVSISNVFKSPGGLAVSGKVNAGYLQAGDRVLVMPSMDMAAVKNIVVDDMAPKIAFAGDQVTLSLTNIDMTSVSPGFLLCDPKHPTRSAVRIRAKIVVFSPDQPITTGMPIVFHYQSVNEPAHFKRLVATLNKSTGEVIKNRPKCLTKNGSAIVEIEFEHSVCVELYSEYRDLGRFMLRTGCHTIAAGLIEEMFTHEDESLLTQDIFFSTVPWDALYKSRVRETNSGVVARFRDTNPGY